MALPASLEKVTRELVLIGLAFPLYTLTHALVRGRVEEADGNARAIVAIERSLGIHWEPQLQEAVLDFPVLSRALNFDYVFSFLPPIALVAALLYLRYPNAYPLVRNAFLISGALSLIVYASLPTTPPRLLAGHAFVDTVLIEFGASRPLSPSFFVNEHAAMPSLHFGWILLLAGSLSYLVRQPLLRPVPILLPVLMLLAIVATANHYLLDAAGGLVAVVAGLGLALVLRHYASRREAGGNPLPEAFMWLLAAEPHQGNSPDYAVAATPGTPGAAGPSHLRPAERQRYAVQRKRR
jgi:hypothetical protein